MSHAAVPAKLRVPAHPPRGGCPWRASAAAGTDPHRWDAREVQM
ncbi:MAG TPA: hypothetical protein VKV05_06840 [Terriglobales bacterium]|nr:hypothetical protein [Terriglobales bacterium]